MKKTTYYSLLKPEGTDAVDIQNFNDNFDTIDNALHDAADASGDLSKGVIYATVAASRSDIESGNTLGVVIGKVMKWLSDLKTGAFATVANNDTVTAEGYVADARVVKVHGDEIDTLNTQMGGLYLGQNASGKWGYKTSANGSVVPFRNPTGTATAAQVLSGYTFANASSDSNTGSMANNGDLSRTLTPSGNNTATYVIPAGYTSGGTLTADGRTSYSAGYSAGNSAGFTSGYNNRVVAVMLGWSDASDVSVPITAGKYQFYYVFKSASSSYDGSGAIKVTVGSATYLSEGFSDDDMHMSHGTLDLPAGTMTLHVNNGSNNNMHSGLLVVYKA